VRGLRKPTTSPALITGGAVAMMAAAAGLVLSGCGTSGEGVRKEGPAQTDSAAKATPHEPSASTPAQERIDAVKLLKSDPKVSSQIKRSLKPCAKNQYPIDVTYGQLTQSSANDIVINVLTCGDSFGIGAYVYRPKGNSYENVYEAEQSPVYADIDRKDLRITRQIYATGDAVCCPSGEDVVTYHWSDGGFREAGRTHTDYSKTVNNDKDDLPSEGTEG
jgi:hypothetical protein